MDLSYTPEEEAFRQRVRSFLEENVPEKSLGEMGLEESRKWQRKLQQAGLLGAAWPKEHGGAGLADMEQAILNEELTRIHRVPLAQSAIRARSSLPMSSSCI